MTDEIKGRIYTAFASTASGLGYSEVHGRIIGCLLITPNPVSLSTIAKETGYSPSMISLSLDFLENLDMIERARKHGDRRLYVRMKGDLMKSLRKAVRGKLDKSVADSKKDFDSYKREIRKLPESEEKTKLLERVDVLDKEVKRFQRYVWLISKITPP